MVCKSNLQLPSFIFHLGYWADREEATEPSARATGRAGDWAGRAAIDRLGCRPVPAG